MTGNVVTTMYLSRLGGVNDMNNPIYSAEFAKQVCDEYNSLTNKMNRSIKEAVSKGEYETSLVLPTNCYDYDNVVECFNQFKNLGYDISVGNDDRLGYDFFRISISWE